MMLVGPAPAMPSNDPTSTSTQSLRLPPAIPITQGKEAMRLGG